MKNDAARAAAEKFILEVEPPVALGLAIPSKE